MDTDSKKDIFVNMDFKDENTGKSFRDFVMQFKNLEVPYNVLGHTNEDSNYEWLGYIFDQQNFLEECKLRDFDVRAHTYGDFHSYVVGVAD